ncbi:MAG: ABC transporter ATP-binding protein [Bacillota bacterium]|nr:ABC transporter ATP-binding protein [Bacillota bacterium]
MDMNYKIAALDILKERNKKGDTIICVIHDINLAYKYSDHIIVIKDGKLYKQGDPNDVLNVDTIRDVFGISVEKIENKGFL